MAARAAIEQRQSDRPWFANQETREAEALFQKDRYTNSGAYLVADAFDRLFPDMVSAALSEHQGRGSSSMFLCLEVSPKRVIVINLWQRTLELRDLIDQYSVPQREAVVLNQLMLRNPTYLVNVYFDVTASEVSYELPRRAGGILADDRETVYLERPLNLGECSLAHLRDKVERAGAPPVRGRRPWPIRAGHWVVEVLGLLLAFCIMVFIVPSVRIYRFLYHGCRCYDSSGNK